MEMTQRGKIVGHRCAWCGDAGHDMSVAARGIHRGQVSGCRDQSTAVTAQVELIRGLVTSVEV
jgi:hypothetical protein